MMKIPSSSQAPTPPCTIQEGSASKTVARVVTVEGTTGITVVEAGAPGAAVASAASVVVPPS